MGNIGYHEYLSFHIESEEKFIQSILKKGKVSHHALELISKLIPYISRARKGIW
ncbi:MAG: hypothetical protein JW891_08630 [Candidatus Lokiarchaeota archaeon]|nr:hypothetical protein [Candidatus Lokiarchaeota archaeon]